MYIVRDDQKQRWDRFAYSRAIMPEYVRTCACLDILHCFASSVNNRWVAVLDRFCASRFFVLILANMSMC
jgi:hypothetical protein